MILHPRILIVVGDDDRAEAVESLLKGGDYQAVMAPDVLAAMAQLKAEPVDLVLLDDRPGELFLTDAIRILKSLGSGPLLPVLCLLTDGCEAAARAAVLDAGADDYLCGRPDPVELQARLRRLLALRERYMEFEHGRGQLEQALARESQLLRQLRSDNRRLRERSITDGLTSLYNHRYLMEWLKTEFKIARRYGHPISFVMADLDHFKQVNDQYGHPFGDYVLKEVAVLCKRSARDSDLVARYGGEEFAMVLPRTDRSMARIFAERFHAAVAETTFCNAAHRVQATVSIGVATYPEHAEITSPEMLVYLADQALLEAKATGRNKIVAWDEIEIERRAMIRRRLAQTPERSPLPTPTDRDDEDRAA